MCKDTSILKDIVVDDKKITTQELTSKFCEKILKETGYGFIKKDFGKLGIDEQQRLSAYFIIPPKSDTSILFT